MTTLRQTFADIADAIRAKGVSGTFKPIDMARKIGEIQAGGSEDYGYLTFTAEEDTTLTLKQTGVIAPHKLLKSTDAVTWVKWENPSTNGISLNAGESVYIKADEDAITRTAYSSSATNYFSSTGRILCSGDVRSLIKNMVAPGDYQSWFSGLFDSCSSLTSAPELPTTLVADCYSYMFRGCTSLTSAPELPATTLAINCYYQMFYECSSLTSAPELPATTLFNQCYSNMFYKCTSLTQAPELPATTMTIYCYSYMFASCSSLTSAPELPATTLDMYCYQGMFQNCSSLAQASELPAMSLTDYCYHTMFSGCTSLTTAPSILPATTLALYCYYKMFLTCKSLTSAPELPATTMANYCYSNMFQNCTALKRIKMNASSGSWGTYMFNGCTSLELVDMTGSIGVPTLSNVNNFSNTNDTYKIVVPDSLYNTWIASTNWASIASHIMKQSDWNAAHPDDQL